MAQDFEAMIKDVLGGRQDRGSRVPRLDYKPPKSEQDPGALFWAIACKMRPNDAVGWFMEYVLTNKHDQVLELIAKVKELDHERALLVRAIAAMMPGLAPEHANEARRRMDEE